LETNVSGKASRSADPEVRRPASDRTPAILVDWDYGTGCHHLACCPLPSLRPALLGPGDVQPSCAGEAPARRMNVCRTCFRIPAHRRGSRAENGVGRLLARRADGAAITRRRPRAAVAALALEARIRNGLRHGRGFFLLRSRARYQ